jgi:hypothetical protein
MMMGRPGETPTPLMLALRNAMARTVLIVGFGLLVLWIFLISLTLMVSWQTVFALAAVGWTVALLFWKKFIGLYAEAQFALHATLNPLPSEAESIPAVTVMSEAILEAVTIPSDSWVVGKAIRDLGLRESTGTSAVGLERGGQSRINPGADEILRAADVLVVLGNQAQVRDAQDYLIRGDK